MSEPKPKVNNEEIWSVFATGKDIRSKCAACGMDLKGTMDELAEHFRNCNGPS